MADTFQNPSAPVRNAFGFADGGFQTASRGKSTGGFGVSVMLKPALVLVAVVVAVVFFVKRGRKGSKKVKL
jgi:hypothetical protein